MRAVAIALSSRAARKASVKGFSLVRIITREGIEHSFDRHSVQWFGRLVTKETHLNIWRSLIERATESKLIFPWSSGASNTIAHLARIEGKYFVVQFFEESGELATAFVPNSNQLRQMLRLIQ